MFLYIKTEIISMNTSFYIRFTFIFWKYIYKTVNLVAYINSYKADLIE